VTDSPIPPPDDPNDPIARARAVRWTSTVIASATFFLFVFNAAALKNWAASLNPTDITVAAGNLAADWQATTAKVGLTAPRTLVHDAWAKGRALTFPQPSGRTGADEPPPQ
jgi:hypothetical protein